MHVFLVYVRDEAYFRLLPGADRGSGSERRVRVMAFPPLGIQTLAPVLRRGGHRVRMFDTCHPHMRAEHIAQAAGEDRPDVIALSFLSVTAYPALKSLARRLKSAHPEIPIIVGGAFASINSARILGEAPYIDHVGVGEGEELLPDYLDHLDAPEAVAGLTWRRAGEVIGNEPRALIRAWSRNPAAAPLSDRPGATAA